MEIDSFAKVIKCERRNPRIRLDVDNEQESDIFGNEGKYRGETAHNASTITRLVQLFRGTESVADRKRSGRAYIVKTKVADGDIALQRNPLKRLSVCKNIITEFMSFLKVMKGTLERF
ncbi:DUF4817 domain-containing protein [Trichonephila clavipes]|nr:DUF4817 domain-containing protein [Trichonephila clavipes]